MAETRLDERGQGMDASDVVQRFGPAAVTPTIDDWRDFLAGEGKLARALKAGRKPAKVPAKCKPAAAELTRRMMAGTIAGWSLVEAGRWAIWSTEDDWARRFEGRDAHALILTDDEVRHYTGTAPAGRARKSAEPAPDGFESKAGGRKATRAELVRALREVVDAPSIDSIDAARLVLMRA